MLNVFIETQVCENERIFECPKIFNTISHKRRLKKRCLFSPKDTKKSFKEINFCNENIEKIDLYTLNILHYSGTHDNTTHYSLICCL